VGKRGNRPWGFGCKKEDHKADQSFGLNGQNRGNKTQANKCGENKQKGKQTVKTLGTYQKKKGEREGGLTRQNYKIHLKKEKNSKYLDNEKG